nr:hypothetical protein [uncultured Undibacterium sp.]
MPTLRPQTQTQTHIQQPHIIVIGGPNGAGKPIAPLVFRDYLAVPDFANADQIAAGLSAFNPEGAAFEAGRIMLGTSGVRPYI